MNTIEKLKMLKVEVDINAKRKQSTLDPDYIIEVIEEAILFIAELKLAIEEIKGHFKGFKHYQVWKLIPIFKIIQGIVNRF